MSISPKLNDNFIEKESRNRPGPGSYEQSASATLKSMPAFKIGSSKRAGSISKERLLSPDPCVYNPTDTFVKTSSAAFGFGTSKRQSIDIKGK